MEDVTHFAGGSYGEMRWGEVDEQAALVHFTKCGLQLGLDSLAVTDNPEDATCPDCA